MKLKNLRPEDYANKNLRDALSISGISKEDIHDRRVKLRKYFDVLYSLYPVYENPDCLVKAKDLIHKLGVIRDMDVICYQPNRDKLAEIVSKKIRVMNYCFLPKVYGSRLLVFNRILSLQKKIEKIEDFHELRKIVRTTRNLVESLGYKNKELSSLAKEMGDLRDEILKIECKGRKVSIDVENYKKRANEIIVAFIIYQGEFHHFSLQQ